VQEKFEDNKGVITNRKSKGEHLSSPLVYFCGVHVAQSLVFCVVVCSILYVLCAFVLLVIELSALRFTVCDYPFVIFKLFLHIKDNLKHIIANNRMLALVLVDGLQNPTKIY
jgi:hypothetical protein